MTIVTVSGPDGQPLGMTASSLASVSLQPPLVSLCIDHQADLHDTIRAAEIFVVNILESAQEALSRRFADPHEDRFDDHTIVIGRVIGGSTGEGRPLLYYRGGYAALE